QNQAAQATKTATDRLIEQHATILGFSDANLALRQALQAWTEDQLALNDAVKQHGQRSKEAADASLSLESSALHVIDAAGKEAAAHYADANSIEAHTAATNAQDRKALELAATLTGPVPLALQQYIFHMDNASLSALGAARSTDTAGNAVIRLPGGKLIQIDANDQASRKINGIQDRVDSLHGKWIDVYVNTILRGPPSNQIGSLE